MDTITHALFGIVIYKSIDKDAMSKEMKRALLFTSLVGSEIPDIDVASQLWDSSGLYLMWHRGITHSLFLVPVWAALLTALAFLFWRVYHKRIFYLGLLAVFIHVTIDNFNAWGTGYFEPFSSGRIALGTVPIIDFVIWGIILLGFAAARMRRWRGHRVYRIAAGFIVAHVLIQSLQGYLVYQSVKDNYEQVTLAATFVPGSFKAIGKKDNVVEILQASVWRQPRLLHALPTAEQADLQRLFEQNPEAETLFRWSPLVVVVDNERQLGIYDPRFYENGRSFLYEYIEK